jgi:hypothetical protein
MRRALKVGMVAVLVIVAVACRKDFDFDGDGKADKYYLDTNVGDWYRLNPAPDPPTLLAAGHGPAAPGDYDGDGRWEASAVAGSTWWSETAGSQTWARPDNTGPGSAQYIDIVQGDYDGDGKTDPAFYRERDATWFIKGRDPVQFGTVATNFNASAGYAYDQDFPVPADYDGDGKTDLSTYNPRTAAWRIRSSATGTDSSVVVGTPGAWPAPADYDGDGKADRAVVSWAGVWTIDGQSPVTFGPGSTTDLWYPTVADYDGDKKADVSYVRFANSGASVPSFWHIRSSKGPIFAQTTEMIPASAAAGTKVFPAQMSLDLVVATARWTLAVRCANDVTYC